MNLQDRVRILCALDIQGARRMIGPEARALSDEGILVGMHKTRLHMTAIPPDLRQQSLDWLREHGFKDIGGAPLPDQVPEQGYKE